MIIDLIIPAFNEESNINALFDALDALPENLIRHIILADNNSTDRTVELASSRGAEIVKEVSQGYGSACLKALDWIKNQSVKPDIVVFLDADLSDDPTELPRLIKPIEEDNAEIVIGSRVKKAEQGSLKFVQRFGNGLACTLMYLLSGKRFSDLGPFRVLKYETLEKLKMNDRTWGWTVEMQMKAAILDIPFEEVDVRYRKRLSGKSKISGTLSGVIAAGTKIITTIIVLWWQKNDLRNDYQPKSDV